MPSLKSLISRALPAFTLFYPIASAQTCYYPDGITVSDDVPCNNTATASACCSPDSFCMASGLCYGAGRVSRGSCTDKTWGSEACAGYCKTESPSAPMAISPCSSNAGVTTFVCGLNHTDCDTDVNTWTVSAGTSLVLRPDQFAALVTPTLNSVPSQNQTAPADGGVATVTYCPSRDALAANTTGMYTSNDMAGLGCGLGLPLGLALIAALVLLRKEKQKHAKPKLMYKLPDGMDSEFSFRPPPPIGRAQSSLSRVSTMSGANVATATRHASVKSVGSSKPAHLQSFAERYQTLKKSPKASELDFGQERHELDGAPPYQEVERHELAEVRMSK